MSEKPQVDSYGWRHSARHALGYENCCGCASWDCYSWRQTQWSFRGRWIELLL